MLHEYLKQLDEAGKTYRVRLVAPGYERVMTVARHDEEMLVCERAYPGAELTFVRISAMQTIDVLVTPETTK